MVVIYTPVIYVWSNFIEQSKNKYLITKHRQEADTGGGGGGQGGGGGGGGGGGQGRGKPSNKAVTIIFRP
jgi:hypothetical protein